MALIGGVLIAVVAAFTRAHDPVTADIDLAVALAAIPIDGIAIVAGFIALLTCVAVRSLNTIATASRFATTETGIGFDSIPVIAILTVLNDAIPAAGTDAGGTAVIVCDLVPIITFFDPRL